MKGGTWGLMLGGAFDPVMTVYQIVCMQAAFYLGAVPILFVLDAVTLQPTVATLAQLFSPTSISSHALSMHSWWVTLLGYLLNVLPTSFAVARVVGKARRAADFSFTIFLLHAVASCIYDFRVQAFLSWGWWISMVVLASLTTFLSEALCMKSELTEIPLGLFSQHSSSASQTQHIV